MLSAVIRNSLISCNAAKQTFCPNLCAPFLKRLENISVLHTTVVCKEEEGFPLDESIKKYKKPVDWLPFPWHRRPMFNIFEQSGDLVKTTAFDPSWPKPDFELSDELKTATEDVKKVFSLENGSRTERIEAYKRELVRRVQRHPQDFDSLEVKIAVFTARVRALFDHGRRIKKEIRGGRIILPIMIQKRNKWLNRLRKLDHDRYCWVLEQLELEFTPPPMQVVKEKYCKKWDLRRLTREYCERVVHEKKAAYHEELKKQQADFLKEKEEILAWIAKEEKELLN